MARGGIVSSVYGEEIYRIDLGQGLYTAELPSNIPDGFSANAYNLVATGDSLENRVGIRPSSIDFSKLSTQFPTGFAHHFCQLSGADPAVPTLAWGNGIISNTLSFIRGTGTGSGDGYMEVAMPNMVFNLCQYNDTIYFSTDLAGGIYKITGFNWVADSISYISIPSAASLPKLLGLFTFKDRIWGWDGGNKLYFTEIAATGGLPETWAATNFIPIQGSKGKNDIVQIVPIRNKFLIFTTSGLYTLMVQGDPASWILRVLDSNSYTTHPESAFESKGIVYYVNTNGVFATNGESIVKLSGVIEDQFFLSKGKRVHGLQFYEDGMILSIAKRLDSGVVDSPHCRVFYSKLEPVAWTEWGIHPPEGETNAWGTNRLCFVCSVSNKLPTFLNSDPTVYMLCLISDSTEASPQSMRFELLIFDGGENKGRDRQGDLITTPLRVAFKTKYVDGGNPYSLKFLKEGMLELFTSDALHDFSYSWDFDTTSGASSTIPGNPDFEGVSVGNATNFIRLKAGIAGGGLQFRRVAMNFASSLQTNLSQIKIKDLALRLNTARNEFEQVR